MKLQHRQIDTDTQIRLSNAMPARQLLTSLAKHPAVDLEDQTGFFSNRDKFSRRNDSLLRMLPANQRLRAAQCQVAHMIYGLKVHPELFGSQGFTDGL